MSDLSVNKTDLDMEVRDGKRVELTCTLTSGDPASLYALYMGRGSCSCSSHRVPLVILGHDCTLKYPDDNQGL